MISIDRQSHKSICEQIVDNTKEFIVRELILCDEKLPSVRELSKQLRVNPNTIQKAYSILEDQGYIYTSKGLGSFVSKSYQGKIDESEFISAKKLIKDGLDKLFYLGIGLEESNKIISEMIKERKEWI